MAEIRYSSDNFFESPRKALDFFLDHSFFRTKNIFEAHATGKGGMIFRGQSDASRRLIPTAFREGAFDDYTPQAPGKNDDSLMNFGVQLHAEGRAINLFLQAADEIGITNPIDYTQMSTGRGIIKAALNENHYDYNEEFPLKCDQRATALAQHHGVPTRYLDWSESPLVALYFAAFGASSFSKKIVSKDREIAVYYLSVSQVTGKNSPLELVRAPRHESSHLLQQVGVFTNLKYANQFFIKNKHWPSVEDYITPTYQVHRIRLPAQKADETLRMLYDLGVTRHSLMPTLGNAAKSYSYAKTLWSGNSGN